MPLALKKSRAPGFFPSDFPGSFRGAYRLLVVALTVILLLMLQKKKSEKSTKNQLREVGSLKSTIIYQGFFYATIPRWFGWEWDFRTIQRNSTLPTAEVRAQRCASGIISVARCLFTSFNFIHILLKGRRQTLCWIEPVWKLVRFLEDGSNSAKKMRWKFPKTHHIIRKLRASSLWFTSVWMWWSPTKSLSFSFPRHPCLLVYVLPRSKYQLSSSCG